MSNQFKPGDLAIVVGFSRSPKLLGSVVELFAYAAPGESYKAPDGKLLRNGDGPAWVVIKDGYVSVNGHYGFAQVSVGHLMPLRGDFQPERQQSREVQA